MHSILFPNRLEEARKAIRTIRQERKRKQTESLKELLLKHAIELRKCR